MDKIKKTAAMITGLNHRIMDLTQDRLDNLTKPPGSLGKLEELVKLIAGITGKETPTVKNKVVFTVAADHGVTEEGVSAYPKEVTAQMVYNFLRGGAGINVLAKHYGVRVIVIDMGVAEKIKAKKAQFKNFKDIKINYGTKNMAKGPAMTRLEAIKSIEAGIDIFKKERIRGIDIIGTGEMGIGNTTSSSAIASVITASLVEDVTGKGTGISDAALLNKIKVIKAAIDVNKPNPDDAIDVLAKVGGFEIGGLTGIILAAAAAKTPVVIDGFISSTAALLAFCIQPKVKEYLVASHASVEKGHKIILDYIGLKPLLDLSLRLGEGTGAVLGINIAEAALKILSQMATFKAANVSEKIK